MLRTERNGWESNGRIDQMRNDRVGVDGRAHECGECIQVTRLQVVR